MSHTATQPLHLHNRSEGNNKLPANYLPTNSFCFKILSGRSTCLRATLLCGERLPPATYNYHGRFSSSACLRSLTIGSQSTLAFPILVTCSLFTSRLLRPSRVAAMYPVKPHASDTIAHRCSPFCQLSNQSHFIMSTIF